MHIYHVTTAASAAKIREQGFRDTTNHEGITGVWFAIPAVKKLSKSDGSRNDTIVSIEVSDEMAKGYEIDPLAGVPESVRAELPPAAVADKSRAYCVPASVINEYLDTIEIALDPDLENE